MRPKWRCWSDSLRQVTWALLGFVALLSVLLMSRPLLSAWTDPAPHSLVDTLAPHSLARQLRLARAHSHRPLRHSFQLHAASIAPFLPVGALRQRSPGYAIRYLSLTQPPGPPACVKPTDSG
jgi:hypothetical protein